MRLSAADAAAWSDPGRAFAVDPVEGAAGPDDAPCRVPAQRHPAHRRAAARLLARVLPVAPRGDLRGLWRRNWADPGLAGGPRRVLQAVHGALGAPTPN